MSCRVLIFTTVNWTSTARHAAGFALAGCKVEALAPAQAPVTISRYVSAVYPYRSLSPLPSVRRAIHRARPDLIVSCDDRAVQHLLRLYCSEPQDSAVAKTIARSLGAPDEYARVMSREASMQAARELGIRTPDILPVPDVATLESCLNVIGLPAALKADGSWGGEGVAIVRTREEARSAYRRLANPPSRARSLARAVRRKDAHYLAAALMPRRRTITIQKFVEGRPAASAFAAWNGEVVAAVHYDVLKADGTIGPPSVIRRVACPEIEDATKKLARRFRLSGLHGLDFIRDAAGHVHLLEINPRATQGGTLPYGPGRDLAAALASCISPTAKPRPPLPSNTVVFFPQEWLSNPASAYLRDGHHDVPWDDPAILRASLQDAAPPPRSISASTQDNTHTGLSMAAAGAGD